MRFGHLSLFLQVQMRWMTDVGVAQIYYIKYCS